MKSGQQLQQPPQLPAGWTIQSDPTTFRPYYYNNVSRTSQWEPPPSTQSVQSNDSGWELQSMGYAVVQPVAQAVTSLQSLLPQFGSQSAAGTFPDGWTMHEDPITKRSYYYNATSKTSSWSLPSQPASNVPTQPTAAVVDDRYMNRPSITQPSSMTTGTSFQQQQQQQQQQLQQRQQPLLLQQQQRQQPLTPASLMNRNIYLYNVTEDRFVMTNGTTYTSNLIPRTERPPGMWRCGSRFFVMPLHNGQVG